MDLTDFLGGDDEMLPVEARKQAHAKTTSNLPGRDEFGDDIYWGDTGAIDHVLQGRTIEGASVSAVRDLTEKSRAANALKLPVEAGTRVAFKHNIGSVLAYATVPDDKGTVVTVRSADGDVTAHNGMVMVAWDDGNFLPVSPEHLKRANIDKKRASSVRVSFIEFSSISSMFEQAKNGDDDLVHRATKDLWSFKQDGDNYVIERLFSEDGNPLKD